MEIIENILNNKYISRKLWKELTIKFNKLSKKSRQLCTPKIKQYYISKNFDNNIILMMGGIENMINIPILKWNDKFIGSTDYIDKIKPENMHSKIMIGIDCYKRPFICFRTKRYHKKFGEIFTVDTLFQRYTAEKKTWTNGTCGPDRIITESGYFYSGGKFRHEHVKQNIKNLLENKGYILEPPWHYGQKDTKMKNIICQ